MDNVSLLREKFTIRDLGSDSPPVIALGNRLKIDLPKQKTPLIIRGHSMHMTLRYGAEILKHLSFIGQVENIETLMDWEELWNKLIKPFENDHVPDTWIALYYEGKVVYQSGHHHMFFDIIEQTEFKQSTVSEGYDQSIIMAQNAFKQMGRSVMIEQESHVGFVLDDGKDEMRFAVILRTPEQKATFIGRLSESEEHKIRPYDYACMQLAADYIEGINMAVRSGFMDKDISSGDMSYEGQKFYTLVQKRMKSMILGIDQAERKYKVLYRPEKPDFQSIQKECFES